MDPVTHTMTGAVLARGGLDRRTPLALATLVLAANAPDVDVLSYAEGSYAALALRRGLTHGVAAMLLLPVAVTGLVVAWDRWVRRRRRPASEPARPAAVLGLAALGLWTHPVLDWMNVYGMRWLVPFSGEWTYGDALFIVDPWIWLLLGGALHLAGPRGGSRESAWFGFWALATALVVLTPVPVAARVVWGAALICLLGARTFLRSPEPDVRRRVVAGGAAAAALYVAAMVGLDLAASRRVSGAAAAQGVIDVREVMVAPRPANPLAGDVVVRTGTTYVVGEYAWLGAPAVRLDADAPLPVRAGPGLGPARVERVTSAAAASPRARDFLTWSRFPLWRVHGRTDGWSVRIEDVRYRGRGSLGGLVVELDRELRVRGSDSGSGGVR